MNEQGHGHVAFGNDPSTLAPDASERWVFEQVSGEWVKR